MPFLWERIIVPLDWRPGHLKFTYPGRRCRSQLRLLHPQLKSGFEFGTIHSELERADALTHSAMVPLLVDRFIPFNLMQHKLLTALLFQWIELQKTKNKWVKVNLPCWGDKSLSHHFTWLKHGSNLKKILLKKLLRDSCCKRLVVEPLSLSLSLSLSLLASPFIKI